MGWEEGQGWNTGGQGWAVASGGGDTAVVTPVQLHGLAAHFTAGFKQVTFAGTYPTSFSGSGNNGCTFTGIPTPGVTKSFEVIIDFAGIRGVATFKWKHNGVLQASGVPTAASVLLTDGVTANFNAVGAYVLNDSTQTVPSVATWSSSAGTCVVSSSGFTPPAFISAITTGASRFPANATGFACLRFNGTSDAFDSGVAGGVAFAGMTSPWAIGMVINTNGAGAASAIAMSDNNSNYMYTVAATLEERIVVFGGAIAVFYKAVANSPGLWAAICNGDGTSFFPAGSSDPTGNPAPISWDPRITFAQLTSGDFNNCDIIEVWLQHGLQTRTETVGLGNYVIAQYGIPG